MNIENLLYTLKYSPDTVSHLKTNNDLCVECTHRCCTHICPACVYEWNDETNEMIINYENCLECGACRVACDKQSISWQYPKGNKGVVFKQG